MLKIATGTLAFPLWLRVKTHLVSIVEFAFEARTYYVKALNTLGRPVQIASSVNGVPIRLTEERWAHIVENKPYMRAYYEKVLATVENPTWVLRGYAGALIAVQCLSRRQFLNVVYREVSRHDGFVITAFVSRTVERRNTIWPKGRR